MRQIQRELSAEVGAGPLALARAKRAQTARVLIEASFLTISEVAFAAGFASIRAFNDTIQDAATAVPGVEEWRAGAYRRTIRLPHGCAVVALRPTDDHVSARISLTDQCDLACAISRCRWMLDLDADPEAVDAVLSADSQLARLVASNPGRGSRGRLTQLSSRSEPFWGNRFRSQLLAPTRRDWSAHTVLWFLIRTVA